MVGQIRRGDLIGWHAISFLEWPGYPDPRGYKGVKFPGLCNSQIPPTSLRAVVESETTNPGCTETPGLRWHHWHVEVTFEEIRATWE